MKGKILGLSNTDDSMWYRFAPEDSSLKLVDEVFDIYDSIWEEETGNIYSYDFKTQQGETGFHKKTADFIIYVVINKNYLHLILRKVKKWEKLNEEITKRFEFVKD